MMFFLVSTNHNQIHANMKHLQYKEVESNCLFFSFAQYRLLRCLANAAAQITIQQYSYKKKKVMSSLTGKYTDKYECYQ